MKQSIFAFVVLSVLFLSCQNSTQTTTQVNEKYTPEKTEPMELTAFETIKLSEPNVEGGDALLAAMKNRESFREFNNNNLSLKHLSEILWATNGVNRNSGKRTVPSAMAMYPLDTYVFLPNGVYFYEPSVHELQPVVEGDHRQLAGLQPFVNNAPLNIVLIANYNRYNGDRPVPADKRLYLAALDAGHCTQNIYLYCASEGLKSVVRAGAQEQALLELLDLDENYQFVVAHTVGY